MNGRLSLQTIATTLGILATLGGIVASFNALYLADKLAPISKSINEHSLRIQAIENDYSRGTTMDTGFKHVLERMDQTDSKIDKLSNKLDSLYIHR